ncbi:MAG: hypothetical protein EBZ67_06980 [Chitinophagia bacterium]|nr:hypothetical protein [Chitinophagia bacterium]
MRHTYGILLLLGVSAGILSCKKASNPNDENEHEAINKVELSFSRPGAAVATFVMEDPDGDGGNPPSRIDTIRLLSNQTYTLNVRILNIVSGRETDLTPSIIAQGKAHELYFIPSGLNLSVTKTDKDAAGYPVGVTSTWTVGAAGTGSVQLKLMHKAGIKGPNDAPTVGHTDLQVVVPARVSN